MTYGARVWGDPCPGCGYSWATTYEHALELIGGSAARYAPIIRGREEAAMEKPDPSTWSPSGYVWHLSDWVRIQGQRIYAIVNDPLYRWVRMSFSPADLGDWFRYDELPPTAGLWALQKAAGAFVEAATEADRVLVFDAGEGDSWTVGDLVVWVGHEVVHHENDIRKGIGLATSCRAASIDRGSRPALTPSPHRRSPSSSCMRAFTILVTRRAGSGSSGVKRIVPFPVLRALISSPPTRSIASVHGYMLQWSL